MTEVFKPQKISDSVWWTGAVDWNIRDFHGYSTQRGTTYNAFLVEAEKPALIDTVKKPFLEEFLARLRAVDALNRIRYVVSNHAEMDHSGCLTEIVRLVRPEKVFASAPGAKALRDHFGSGLDITVVADGTRLDLGGKTLHFMETRLLHWPDSMVTLLEEEKILFSQDAFGMHLAGSARFDTDSDPDAMHYEAAKYYANILLPYSHLVLKLLEKIRQAGLEFRLIAPDHGPVWQSRPDWIIERYQHWATQAPTRKALVVYDTMWGSTDLMARALADGLAAGGAIPLLMCLGGCHRSDVATGLLEAGALLVGSPTLNMNIFPTVADVLTYLRGLKRKNLTGAAFGSYGWANKAVPQILEYLAEMGVDTGGEQVSCVYVPGPETLEHCYRLGGKIASRLTSQNQT